MSWYALQHKPAQGDRALGHLQNQGICAFYPKVSVERVRSGKRCTRSEPLFPGYIFVHLEPTDPMWAKLRSTRGVLKVVGFGGRPVPISDDVIRHIQNSLTAVEAQGGIRPGEAVQLQEGPFEGMNAIFESYDGEARAVVLIQFMQKQQSVKVPLTAIGR